MAVLTTLKHSIILLSLSFCAIDCWSKPISLPINSAGNLTDGKVDDAKFISLKGEPVKVEQRETNYESRRAYAMPKAAGVIATWFMIKNKDMDLFMHDFFKEMYALLTKFTDKQKKRLNENLLENGIEPLSEEGFDELRLAFYEKALDMELPF